MIEENIRRMQKSRLSVALKWLAILILAVLLVLCIYVEGRAILGGSEMKQACTKSLIGMSRDQISQIATNFAFQIVDQDGATYIEEPGKHSGHRCEIEFNSIGFASRADVVFDF